MSRYIKDSEAKQSLYAMFGVTSSINIAIDKTPTADVQEIKHGIWIKEEKSVLYFCSSCGERVYRDYYKFCPNCGAKMDGNTNGDE